MGVTRNPWGVVNEGGMVPALRGGRRLLCCLLRAKIEVKVTRPQVTLRLSNLRAIKATVYTAVSRAKIRGAPAEVFSVRSSNATLKPAEGGRVRSQIREVLLSFAREIS